MTMEEIMTQSNKSEAEPNMQDTRIAVPVDVQIQLAKNRIALAETRYELSVRRGRRWNVPKKETERSA